MMTRRSMLLLLTMVMACSSPDIAGTTSTNAVPVTTTTVPATTSTEPPVECPPPPYDLEFLPVGVGAAGLEVADIEPDVWTSVPGIAATLLGRADGTVGIALIRGTLPPVDWPAEKGEVSIDGTRAAVGPHPDGTWVAGWYEAPGERCDLYTMVLYPPVSPDEVEQVIDGMNRVGG
ncbi:MAG TPA: hypothetical protein VLA91_00135 [Acidimicrobiia bacterium]|nr:hypothetical protein [Acidimicrobiia bacterium]